MLFSHALLLVAFSACWGLLLLLLRVISHHSVPLFPIISHINRWLLAAMITMFVLNLITQLIMFLRFMHAWLESRAEQRASKWSSAKLNVPEALFYAGGVLALAGVYALLNEGTLTTRSLPARFCFYLAGFVMFFEVILVCIEVARWRGSAVMNVPV